MKKLRLDQLLVDRGLFESRSRAAAAVLAGEVFLGVGRERAAKAGHPVAEDVMLEVVGGMPYVSRGGVKLANALEALGVAVSGRRCLDVGASTGGFTDCLLQRGAAHVVALDVGYGELAWKLRADPRVTVIERCNARALDPATLPYAPELIVMDVSFISLTKVLPAVLGAAGPDYDCLAMVKPQFEVGRDRVGKGGVVRDPALRREALVSVGRAGYEAGAQIGGFASSGLPGPKGNRETFLWLRSAGSGSGSASRAAVEPADLEAAALEVDP
jgi:23S rRNA (cytidine1920-2'-O)/16S rRNA (cytidine1409-2'-O)-methyltransferase